VSSVKYTGVQRGCGWDDNKCTKYDNADVPNTAYTHVTGELCACTSNLCNAAPPEMIGHLTVIFISVSSLLALTTGRLLTQ